MMQLGKWFLLGSCFCLALQLLGEGIGVTAESIDDATATGKAKRSAVPQVQGPRKAESGDKSSAGLTVNGVAVSAEAIASLERAYARPIQPGRYWYDKQSGLWGLEGQPLSGQMAPNLEMGGPLKANASKGNTGVFINGRELPAQEVTVLQQFGPVVSGHYWMNAQGIGGVEGGPAIFDLGAAITAQSKKGGGWNRTTSGGHLGGDDNCSYYFDPASGSSVMNCK